MLVEHALFVISDTVCRVPHYEMQLLYVNAKVEIISELNKYLQKKDAPHIFYGCINIVLQQNSFISLVLLRC